MNIFNTKEIYLKACLGSKDLHAMTDEERLKLQAHLRQMYLDIEKICVKYNIQMMVAYGSVLGALRHKGFIPWDDDMDLYMPRKDYDLFVNKYSEELPKKYKVFSPNSKNGPIYRFAKVVDTTTRFTFTPEIATEKSGIYIDIFPLENAVINKWHIRWIQCKACFLMYIATSVANFRAGTKSYKALMCSTLAGKINYYIRQFIGLLFNWHSSEYWYDVFDKSVSKYPYTGYYMVPSDRSFNPIQESLFFPTKKMSFDDIMVIVPNQPEKYCEIEYGKWDIIPPVNKRWQHFIREIKFSVNQTDG